MKPLTVNHPSSAFWDRIADRYARKPVADEAVYRQKLAKTRAYLHPAADVLEFGCGTGSTALAHAPFAERIVATDISARMIAIAREKARSGDVRNVDFMQVGFEEFHAPDAAFDAVLGLSILHLVEDLDATLDKVRRLTKPGGVFVSSTACLSDHMRWFRPLATLGARFGALPKVRFFTADALAARIEAQGFEIVDRWRPAAAQSVFMIARKPG